MIARIWQTSFDRSQKQRLMDYSNRASLPILSSRPGNRGVFFYSRGDQFSVLTLWDDEHSIEQLKYDPAYERIVSGILALGVLGEEQTVELYEYEGGTVPLQLPDHQA